MDFSSNLERSLHIKQYKCGCSPQKRWWGGSENNKCKSCGKTVEPLPLKQMTGDDYFFFRYIVLLVFRRRIYNTYYFWLTIG